jgi:hypothetical protein
MELNKHGVTAHRDSPEVHQCQECPKKFKSLSDLDVHMRGVYRRKQNCDVCGLWQATDSALTEHERKVHGKMSTKFRRRRPAEKSVAAVKRVKGNYQLIDQHFLRGESFGTGFLKSLSIVCSSGMQTTRIKSNRGILIKIAFSELETHLFRIKPFQKSELVYGSCFSAIGWVVGT